MASFFYYICFTVADLDMTIHRPALETDKRDSKKALQ